MKCEEIQESLILREDLTPAAKSHINDCDDCREFQRDLEVMLTNKVEISVPVELDQKILAFAKENHPGKEQKSIIPFVFMAVAALIAIALTVNLLQSGEVIGDQPGLATVDSQPVEVIDKIQQVDRKVEAERLEEQNEILANLWEDDDIDADLLAVESEIFVLSAELYPE